MRRLRDDRIGRAILRIEPEGRRHLETAGQIYDQAVGDVALGHADRRRPGAVDVDGEFRIMRRLFEAHIRRAGNLADAAQQFLRVGFIRRLVRTGNDHIDRRRRAEIQDLTDDVGRQETRTGCPENSAAARVRSFFT